ncbi:hypothetical protein LCGC14_1775450, partial [marine sediment metagenome]
PMSQSNYGSLNFKPLSTYFESILQDFKNRILDLVEGLQTGQYYINDSDNDYYEAYFLLYDIYTYLNFDIEFILPESLYDEIDGDIEAVFAVHTYQVHELIKDFKEGIYNTLVGTSVAEEGLDIEECDLVVFYDVVPSAIRSIQRRGRTGRKKEGKVIILMAEGTRDEGYYWAAKRKEQKMKSSLYKIKSSESSSKLSQSDMIKFLSSKKDATTQQNENPKSKLLSIKKIEGAEKFEIICDNRETASPVVRALSIMGLNLKLQQLVVADYIISERVAIERKSAKDFNNSIIDGRLFTELSKLRESFLRPILILEGDPFIDSNINKNALYGAITSILINLGVSIYKTNNAVETAEFLFQLAKKEQSISKSSLKLRFDKAPIETSQLLEYIIAGIPGVNAYRAKNLLKELKTLQNIFQADILDLTKIDNIGKKIAQQIYKISRFNYKNGD